MNVRTFLMIPALLFALIGPSGCLFPVHDDHGDGHHAAAHDSHYGDHYDSHYDDHHDSHYNDHGHRY